MILSRNIILIALMTLFGWSLQLVNIKYATNLNANPFVFTTACIIVASMVLIIIGGNSKLFKASIKTPQTWYYSITHILLNISVMFMVGYISSTQAMILQKFNIITGFLIGYLLLDKRRLSKTDFIGCFIVIFGIALTLYSLDRNIILNVMFILLIMTTLSTLRTNSVERHKLMKKSKNFKQQCQIIGVVLLFSCLLTIIFMFSLNYLGLIKLNTDIYLTPQHMKIVLINGGILIPLSMFGFFKLAREINSENFAIISSFLPLFTLITEYTASKFGMVEISMFTYVHWISLIMIIIGALFITCFRIYNKKLG